MADDIISRKHARAKGLKHYFTGKPCVNGHIAQRYTASRVCLECGAAAKPAYREANRAELARKSREYYAAHREEQQAARKSWYTRNPEWAAANYQRQREKIAADPARAEAIRQQNKKFRDANPDKITAWVRRRQAAQLQRTPSWLTDEDFKAMQAFYEEAKRQTEQTGIRHEVDHIVPLLGETVCGLHVPWNLQVLTQFENRSKGNKHE